MKLNGPLVTTALSWPLTLGIRAWMRTMDYQVQYADPSVDPLRAPGPPRIYLFWHENILMPLHLRGGCYLSMLLSRHQDADFLAKIAGRMGFDCVRGSTYRGGATALRELIAKSRTHHLTMTPDGPRGPRRTLAQGPIYLASKMGLPLVCLGMAYHRPWRMNSWDRFAIPRPFSRARAVLSGEIHVPPALDRTGIEAWRKKVEQTLNDLTESAQQWADSGEDRPGQAPVTRGRGFRPLVALSYESNQAA